MGLRLVHKTYNRNTLALLSSYLDLPEFLLQPTMSLLSKSIVSAGKTLGLLRHRSPAFVGSSASRGRVIASCFSTATPSKASPIDASGFDTVGIVGLGLMGHGICQIAATSGVHSKVVAFEQEQRFLDSGYVFVCSLHGPRCCSLLTIASRIAY